MRHLLAAAALCAAPLAHAQSDNDPGADMFGYYCANCHGTAADGQGPVARFLTVKVPDLTTLSKRNGGQFPMGDVVHRLDGTQPDVLHNGPMPNIAGVFLDELRGVGDDVLVLMQVRGQVLSIALYLEELQK